MKKLVTCIMVLMAAFAIAGGADDATVSFSTRGPDRYADGTTVMDGECYALVWSADGVFEGLSANGEPVDSSDKVILVISGRTLICPFPVTLIVPIAYSLPGAHASIMF